MKRITYMWFAGIVLGSMWIASASAQNASQNSTSSQSPSLSGTSSQNADGSETSLGSYARAARKDKKQATAKKYDNDNLPTSDKISVVGDNASGAPADGQGSPSADQMTAAASGPSDKPKVEPGQSQEDMQKVYNEWQEKISKQQSLVDMMARELDVTQREYRLRQASMYADAGERLRNQAQWDKEDADYKQKLADKQKALDDAKQRVSDLQEEARKSGVPNSVREEATKPQEEKPQEQTQE